MICEYEKDCSIVLFEKLYNNIKYSVCVYFDFKSVRIKSDENILFELEWGRNNISLGEVNKQLEIYDLIIIEKEKVI